MFFLVFLVTIDLYGAHMQYRSDSAYITRRKRVISPSYGARIVDLSCFSTDLKRFIKRFAVCLFYKAGNFEVRLTRRYMY
jgi:hypothetical protein